jgi:phospholipid/cholesterol/gamma-HCH transport system ATP-binding protein
MADPIISVRDLVVSYGGRRVLDGVNLDIQQGEVLALLGGSGSGKSTMLRHIIGLERPDSGRICVQGVDINNCSARELKALRRDMGVSFQGSALFSSMTIEENVELPLRELTSLADPVIEIMTYIKLASVGLGDAGKLFPQELSGGMKKRAAISTAWPTEP